MRNLFSALLAPQARETGDPQQRERLASAALLLEMARADFNVGSDERTRVKALLARHYGLDDAAVTQLMEDARYNVEQSASLFDYLKTINDQQDMAEKSRLLEMIWQVAYADGKLDPQEEALLRRIADLLHLPHSVFIKTKLAVLASLQKDS